MIGGQAGNVDLDLADILLLKKNIVDLK